MGTVARLEELITRYRLLSLFLLVFLFFQPFGPFAGVRNTAFVLLCLSFLIKYLAGKVTADLGDNTVRAFGLIAVVSVVSSIFSPYMAESFDYMRKNLLYQAVIFLVILSEYKGFDDLKPVFYTVLASFFALSLLILLTNDPRALIDWLNQADKKYTKGYSLYATFYIPFAAAYLYAGKEGLKFKAAIVFLIGIELLLSILNNHRAQIVAIIAGIALVTLIAKRYKVLVIGALAGIVLAVGLMQVDPKALDRYKTLAKTETYMTNEHTGWNNRLAIWSGTLDMVEQRPVAGWGYGWKKISMVAKEQGFIEKWRSEGNKDTQEYFETHGYGSANPHNLAIQILFELGALGLVAFILFWLSVLAKAVSAFRRPDTEGTRLLKYSVLGVLLSYALVNTSNGLWQESYGVMMTTLAACSVVLYKEACAPPDVA